jgi:hypothetical protein
VELVNYFKAQAVRVHAAMSARANLTEADGALVEAVEKLVAANAGRWAGNSKKLRADLAPHAGAAVNLPRWPSSPEAMGHAIRRVARHLAKDRGVQVSLPPPNDKTRTLVLTKQPPKPPQPPSGGGTPSPDSACDVGGSGQSETAAARTAQEGAASQAVRAVGPDDLEHPPEAQPPGPQDVTDSAGGSGGSGGLLGDPDATEDGAI